jgi:hypothetical protein
MFHFESTFDKFQTELPDPHRSAHCLIAEPTGERRGWPISAGVEWDGDP